MQIKFQMEDKHNKNSRQFTKYLIVGGSSFILDMSLLIFIKELFDITAVSSVVISQIIVLTYNFTINKKWSFKNNHPTKGPLVRYSILTAHNYGFGILAMYVGNDIFNIDYRLVRILTVTIMISWNFLLYKHWVYKSPKK